MSLTINMNGAALAGAFNLQKNDMALAQSIGRLSSGFKINTAADDPSGLTVSENLRAQIGGLGAAITNGQNAINLVKTAEGALNEVHSLLQQMRSLAVNAANTGFNDATAQAADQAQVASAIQSLDRIASTTSFGDRNLLDGTAGFTPTIVTGASIASVNPGSAASALKAGYMAVNVTTAATSAAVSTAAGNAFTHAYATAATAIGNAGNVTINGIFIGSFTAVQTGQNVIDAINGKTSQTGVSAAYDGVNHLVTLAQANPGSNNQIIYSETADILNGAAAKTVSGTDAVATVTFGDGSTSVFNAGKGTTLQNAQGDQINLKAGVAVGNLANAVYVQGSALSFQVGANAGQTALLSLAGTASNLLGTGLTGNTFTSTNKIDVTVNASDAIKVLDAAIQQVSNLRANLGAFQNNVLQTNINSLTVAQENVSAAEATIRDTNVAQEMTNFTRLQIMEQAGTSILTQANQQPQQLLGLLPH